jgi:hypothetical protein
MHKLQGGVEQIVGTVGLRPLIERAMLFDVVDR